MMVSFKGIYTDFHATKIVVKKVKNSSKQSHCVDKYLGGEGTCLERKVLDSLIAEIAKTI